MLKFLLKLEVKGREFIPKKGGFILASNHVSFLDPIAVGVASPRRLYYMARHDLFFNRFFGRFLRLINCFPVKRNSADLAALKEAMRRLESGGGLLLFPEGRRQAPGAADEQPQAGIGFLAAKANAPVMPVFVRGTEDALPKGAKFIRSAKVSVCIGGQMEIDRSRPYQEIADIIMEQIRSLSKK